jgi:DNA-binding GntR family transcriptional regulator
MPVRVKSSSSRRVSHATPHPYKNFADRAYYELKSKIVTCQLAVGSSVHERALGDEFGVAPELIRVACHRLLRERLVREEDPQHYTVAPFTLRDIRELTEMRCLIESKAAALAAERVRPHEIARLLILAELSYQPGERRTYMRYLLYNTAFHRQLAHATRNSRLEATVASVLDQIQRPLYLGLDVGLDPQEATAEHLEVVDAVRQKRPALASRLMRQQIASSEKRMIEAYGDNGFS